MYEQGKAVWESIKPDENDFVLLIPESDNMLLCDKIRSAFYEKLEGRQGIVIEGQRAAELLSLYSLYEFTDKLIIGSFDLPCGRKLSNLIKCGVSTEEELINDVILEAMGGA